MTSPVLLDSNVILAAIVETHIHHGVSSAALAKARDAGGLIAAHSFAEAYTQATRLSLGANIRLSPQSALAPLLDIGKQFHIVALSAQQTVDAIERFSQLGGIGARIYDYLIGATARANGAEILVSINHRHFAPLFPDLRILTPADYLAA